MITFKVTDKGVGSFLEMDMEFVEMSYDPDLEVINNDLSLSVDSNIPSFYKPGIKFIIDVVKSNYDLIKPIIGNSNVLKIKHLKSNPAHYQVEIVTGATVEWLNKNLLLNLKVPRFTFDLSKRKFVIGD